MTFKNCLSEAAKFLSVQIPGKGKSTYTKHFEAGVLVLEPCPLGIKKEDVEHETYSCRQMAFAVAVSASSRRIRSSGIIQTCTFYVQDDMITEEVFRYHLEQAGTFIGIGRFRPRNNGYYGRFKLDSMEWLSD